MTTSLGATGVPISHKRPGVYVQVLFGASANGAGGATRTVLLFGHKTSAGSMALDTEEILASSSDDAANYAGEGSELHLMAKAAFLKAPAATLRMIAVTEPAGVKASATITVAVVPTGSGTAYFYVHGVEIPVSVIVSDPVNTIAANLAAAINAKSSELNVVATVLAAVVTITARHFGTRFNKIAVRKKIDASITATTFTLSSATLAGGTGTESLTAALATAATTRHYYYAPASQDTAALQAIQTQMDTMAGPLVGSRQQLIATSVETLGTATTQAEALNEERAQLLWYYGCETLACVITAAWAAMRSVAEASNLSVNLSSMNPDVVDLWPAVRPPASPGSYITDSQCNSALDVGLTPIQVRAGDSHPYVALSITTHSNDSSGNPDTRTLTTNYVTVPDAVADELSVWVPSTFVDMKLRSDTVAGDDPLPPNVTTPGIIKSMFADNVRRNFEQAGHINDLDTDYLSWAFNLISGNPNRVNATIPITPAPWFTQVSAQVRQLTPTV